MTVTASSRQRLDAIRERTRNARGSRTRARQQMDAAREAGDRDAEARLLPAAKDAGCAVLTNLPFGRASMFKKVAGKPLPEWAKEIDARSWAQIFLKFLLSHPAVTAVIPATSSVEHVREDLAAGTPPWFGSAERELVSTLA